MTEGVWEEPGTMRLGLEGAESDELEAEGGAL